MKIVRQYIADVKEYQTALNLAIDYCIDHDILSAFLQSNRVEVRGMLLEEFDVDKYERSLRTEGREEGIEQGIYKMARLSEKLFALGRIDDVMRASTDEEYREKLFREFEL